MTKDPKKGQADRLAQMDRFFIDGLLATSDKALLDEAAEDGVDIKEATKKGREAFELAQRAVGRGDSMQSGERSRRIIRRRSSLSIEIVRAFKSTKLLEEIRKLPVSSRWLRAIRKQPIMRKISTGCWKTSLNWV